MDAAAAKAALRQEVKARMAALPPARRALEEELVQAAVQAEPAWRRAGLVLLYRALPGELSVTGLALAAWRDGKRTAFPRVAGPGRLTLHEARSWSQLKPGAFGVHEPDAALPETDPTVVDLAIVPGVAFDAAGHRLGQGGGFYDRLLPRLGEAWGVGFACQLTPSLPVEAHDAKVHRVVVPDVAGTGIQMLP